MKQSIVNYDFIVSQLAHWLSCPVHGYLGSNYGIDLKQYLHKPMSTFEADQIIAKMRHDIPALSLLPENSINILVQDDDIDGKHILIQVMDKVFQAA